MSADSEMPSEMSRPQDRLPVGVLSTHNPAFSWDRNLKKSSTADRQVHTTEANICRSRLHDLARRTMPYRKGSVDPICSASRHPTSRIFDRRSELFAPTLPLFLHDLCTSLCYPAKHELVGASLRCVRSRGPQGPLFFPNRFRSRRFVLPPARATMIQRL